MGKKTHKNFLNIDRPKTKYNILLYSFTRKSSAPLDQEIPGDRPETLLDVNPICSRFSSKTCTLFLLLQSSSVSVKMRFYPPL
jgi:hypothetical protein